MRFVLIALHYPPDPAVGSQRAFNVARAFASAGHEVHVVTRIHTMESNAVVRADPGITVHAVRSSRSPREVYLMIKKWWVRARGRRMPPDLGAGTATELPGISFVGRAKRWIVSWLWLPDDQQGFILPAARAARALLASDAVLYSTAPPFSPHLAARLAIMGRGTPWAMELRDPWTDNHQKPPAMRSGLTDTVDRWLERRCLRRAQLIVPVSEGIARHLRPKLPADQRGKVLVVYNGIERLRATAPEQGRPFRILHAGTCSYARDPRPFLHALAKVVRSRGLGPDDVIADFVGECRHHEGEALEPLVLQLGLGSIVRFRDWLPRDEALRLMSAANLHLLLAQEQPDQIPNKLYDYLGAGGRILAFADTGGETARLLAEATGHFLVADNDVMAAASALCTALDDRKMPVPASNPRLDALSMSEQMSRLIERVIAIPGRRGG